jgi:hypothetical protein
MPPPDKEELSDLLHRRAEIWRLAEPELRAVRIREASAVSVEEAIRQLFNGMEHLLFVASSPTSGLVEQQIWFSRIRGASGALREPPLAE